MLTSAVGPIDSSAVRLDGDPVLATLAGEHARLLRDLRRRVDPVIALMERHVWPDAELRTLSGFLRAVVLRQASDEEPMLFPSGTAAPLIELTAAHARLHLLTAQLERADATTCSLARLRSLVEELFTVLEAHLREEEAVLSALPDTGGAVPGVAALDEPWPAVTSGPLVISLAAFPIELAVRLGIERILRLRPGQTADIYAGSDCELLQIQRWIARFDSAQYGLAFSQAGQLVLRVTRRLLDD